MADSATSLYITEYFDSGVCQKQNTETLLFRNLKVIMIALQMLLNYRVEVDSFSVGASIIIH